MLERTQSFFKNNKKPVVLVVGDLILDEYIWGSVTRISPEAPVPILESKSENLALGGAANVANNLIALGCEVLLVGGIGQDEKGERLYNLIRSRGINADGVRPFVHRPTTSKIRLIANNQQMLRIDKEDNRPITEETEKKFIQHINKTLPNVDAVICSDYEKGILTEKIVNAIMHRAKNSKKPVIVDPKGTDFTKYSGATAITPNEREVERVAPIKLSSREDLDRSAEYLINLTKAEAILITRGKEGMVLYRKGEKPFEVQTMAREVFDVTGAGDTVISVFGLALASGFDMEEAAWLANNAAGIVVGKVGTAVVTREEIQRFIEDQQFSNAPALMPLDEAKKVVSLAKSCGRSVVFTNGCFDIIHAGHIEFLQKAKALGDILVIGLNSDSSVKSLKGPERPIKSQKERADILAALKYVDYITLFEEDTPENLIREIRPDILVKGDDYTIDEVIGREIVEGYGARVELIPIIKGHSTTGTVEKILEQHK